MYPFQNEPMYLHFYPISLTQYFSITHLHSFYFFFFYTQEHTYTHMTFWFSLYFDKKMKKTLWSDDFYWKNIQCWQGNIKKPAQLDKQWRLWFWWAQWTYTAGVSGCCKPLWKIAFKLERPVRLPAYGWGAKWHLALKLQGLGKVGFCLMMRSLTNLSKAIYIF